VRFCIRLGQAISGSYSSEYGGGVCNIKLTISVHRQYVLCVNKKNLKLERLADSEDGFHNVGSCVAYYQIHIITSSTTALCGLWLPSQFFSSLLYPLLFLSTL
jgi:hypothetical protein